MNIIIKGVVSENFSGKVNWGKVLGINWCVFVLIFKVLFVCIFGNISGL